MIGIDLVENKRMENKSLDFIQRILSTKELEKFNKITDEKRKVQYLASRFAAKEAIFKACKVGNKDLNYSDISVLNEESNAPYIEILKYPDFKFEVSISHEESYSIAIVMRTI
ncbi:MAG: holo-ACP synthase [bacterium]